MNIKKFYQQAIRTCSDPKDAVEVFNQDRALRAELYFLSKRISRDCNKLDLIKKEIFYGKKRKVNRVKKVFWWLISFIFFPFGIRKPVDYDMDILHGIIGMTGETGGELLPAFWDGFFTGVYDKVNIVEEIGDTFWYFSPLVRGLGIYPNEPLEKVILKLRQRYRTGKFTRGEAINRDLVKERLVLEDKNL